MGLLCRWPSITEWEVHITAQGLPFRNDLYYVEWDVKLYNRPTIQTDGALTLKAFADNASVIRAADSN